MLLSKRTLGYVFFYGSFIAISYIIFWVYIFFQSNSNEYLTALFLGRLANRNSLEDGSTDSGPRGLGQVSGFRRKGSGPGLRRRSRMCGMWSPSFGCVKAAAYQW